MLSGTSFPVLTQGFSCCLPSCLVRGRDPFCVACSCSEGTTGERLQNQHVSVPCFWVPHKTVPRSHCAFVGTSQVCAAVLLPAPCPGEVSSTWITPTCMSMTAALVQSFMLWHQFSPPPSFHPQSSEHSLQNISALAKRHLFISEAVLPPHLPAPGSSLCSLGVWMCSPHIHSSHTCPPQHASTCLLLTSPTQCCLTVFP